MQTECERGKQGLDLVSVHEKKESICRIMRGKNTTFQVIILYATFMF